MIRVRDKIGKKELNIYQIWYILQLYDFNDINLLSNNMLLYNNKSMSILIKSHRCYLIMIEKENRMIKIYDSINTYDYNTDLKYLSSYISNLSKYEIIKINVRNNFPEATDIAATVTFMIMNSDYNNIEVLELDVILMSDLLREYISKLLEYKSYRLKLSCFYVNIHDDDDGDSLFYSRTEENTLNFVRLIINPYNYNTISLKGKQKNCFLRQFNIIVNHLLLKERLKSEDLVFYIHFINQCNDNVIDPGNIYKSDEQLRLLSKIKNDGIYFFPVCDKDYQHWSLFEVKYNSNKYIKYYIYDSLNIYRGDYNDARDNIIYRIYRFFESNVELSYQIMETNVKQSNRDKVNCGYYTLFYLGCRMKNIRIDEIQNIESFNINYFIEDLFSAMSKLTVEEKAKFYKNYQKNTLHRF